jgi:Nucleotidyl transferase AbiEii toxin, Type IV TA system
MSTCRQEKCPPVPTRSSASSARSHLALDDGLTFNADDATAEVIREDNEYSGVRVTLTATLSVARLSLHVDVNVGDPIWPEPRTIELPRLLGGVIQLSGYPLHMVYAEKIVTAIQRGTANTRWRDFADVYVLIRRHRVGGDDLQQALSVVAGYRQAELFSLRDVLDGYAGLAQARWAAWRRRLRLEDRLPASFAEVLGAVIEFADPASNSDVEHRIWNPADLTWDEAGALQ